MTTKLIVLLTLLLLTLTLSHSRPTRPKSVSDQLNKHSKDNKNDKGYGSGGYFGPGTGSVPGTGFGLPGFTGKDWGNIGGGYGGGYGGPTGGYSKGGVVRPTVVRKEKGHCYMKKLRCPAKCFKSFSRSGKGYAGGGGGGGCTIDCKKKCVAYC
ncbi:PREDICTED: LOW QUALITY PROTEIN: keratin, type I cytoskeletal 9 [Brassica oleracea var. oleracea]|uniref:LOW QUALITY PROTEIN: keratin, type I cytoskeletal 9 n=1 Tax=Brassica oleracea var. oleracea TaxID=109376 RepID=UPI0006A6EDD7|nr:PREDICTED: LOW QUALITY PROTEIN: keratin, type I cytoskeletal 9 [Brassica oleracea var. oleracea]